MAKKTSAVQTHEQTKLLKTMDPVTQEVAAAGLSQLRKVAGATVIGLYDAGVLLGRLFESEMDDDHRREELQKLARYWGMPSEATLRNLRNVVTTFSREFVLRESTELMANGKSLSFQFFVLLQKIKNEKHRTKFLKAIRKRCLSFNEAYLELKGQKAATHQPPGAVGRKPGIPKSPLAMVQKTITMTVKLDNYLQALEEPFTSSLADKEFPEKLVEQIDKAEVALADVVSHVRTTRTVLREARRKAASGKSKAKRGRPRKAATAETDGLVEPQKKAKRGRPRKAATAETDGLVEPQKKAKRGRPRKVVAAAEVDGQAKPEKKAKRGRPRKAAAATDNGQTESSASDVRTTRTAEKPRSRKKRSVKRKRASTKA